MCSKCLWPRTHCRQQARTLRCGSPKVGHVVTTADPGFCFWQNRVRHPRCLGVRGSRQGAEAGSPVFEERVERGFSGRESPAPLPLPSGSSSFPPSALLSPDPSVFWQIGLSLTFCPVSGKAKPLSDLIIFHFCLIVHILLLRRRVAPAQVGARKDTRSLAGHRLLDG